MGFGNPPVPWSEVERVLSGRLAPPHAGDGNDSPAWSRVRQPYVPPPQGFSEEGPSVPYAELHAHSNFSFLDGASHPEELAEEAARLGLEAVALTDHDGMYGVVRFAEAARELSLDTVFGAELSLGLSGPQNGMADPEGSHLLVLARDLEGYRHLTRSLSLAQLAGEEKGRPVYDLEELAESAAGHWLILTGCRKGAVRQALSGSSGENARSSLDRLTGLFGQQNVAVELTLQGFPDDDERNATLVALAEDAKLPVVATNNVHYATPRRAHLAAALAAVRARRSLDEMDGWLPPGAGAHLRSGAEMAALFARYPDAVRTAAMLAKECAFDLHLVAPRLPPYPVPAGHTETTWLRQITAEHAVHRYGTPDQERVPGAYKQVHRELDLIEKLGFPGYFLIVWDIVQFCLQERILCQGRGSAANSAVCFVLGITPIDPVKFELLFERFLSIERDGPPDIDLDIESGRREEVIQYVYRRYGRHRAAQVANVITYRAKSAVRDMAKALGHPLGQQDAWSKQIGHWGSLRNPGEYDIPAPVLELAQQVEGFPRHLGIHSGGMVLCERPVIDVCPVEWARMPGRTVLQWDKDDCAAMGLVKFDLLGLGMLSALRGAMDLILEHYGVDVEIATMPQEDAVYDMLCAADTVGVFQVESRAQMATLPRLRPRKFYDLVIEVALIRPGPIQGGSVHPYLRRRHGKEEVTYPHPRLEKTLERTLGVPLFQEQLMQMAVDIADFTPSEADQLRRAIGSKRSIDKMAQLKKRLYAGMAGNGITGAAADSLYEKLLAFASYGFPESHSVSFAMLVYASSWIKLHYPAAFCAALLNAQPMGFYSPQSLVGDARRHGVQIRPVDINASGAGATLEQVSTEQQLSCTGDDPPEMALRIGLGSIRTIGTELAELVDAVRTESGPYLDIADLTRRVKLTVPQAEALATAGAFDSFGSHRRESLWAAGALAHNSPDKLAADSTGAGAPALPAMTAVERTVADLWATGITPSGYPTEHLRDQLDAMGVLSSVAVRTATDGSRILVGGIVTHRQRPATASGTTFMTLEDETGLLNIICSPGVWVRYRTVAQQAPALLIRGRLESAEGVLNVVAEAIHALPTIGRPGRSRDFR
jgi:error-prone DNA polymerase